MAIGSIPAAADAATKAIGSKRQRRRREVAGPYRSQSTVPSVKAGATQREHRSVVPTTPPPRPIPGITAPLSPQPRTLTSALAALPTPIPAPQTALQAAIEKGTAPSEAFKQQYGAKITTAIEDARIKAIGSKENLKELGLTPDLGPALATLMHAYEATARQEAPSASIAQDYSGARSVAEQAKKSINFDKPYQPTVHKPTGPELPAALAIMGYGTTTGEGAPVVEKGAEKALTTASNIPKAASGARQALIDALKAGARKAEPGAVRSARAGAAKVAGNAPKSVKVAAKIATKAVTLPVKRPFTAPFAAEIPAAAIHGELPHFGRALSGTGVFANIASTLGTTAASAIPGEIAQNIVKDAFNLPAVALPSVYLPVAGIVEASQGDPARLDKLWQEYTAAPHMENGKEVHGWGAIPALLRGDFSEALQRIKEHPLYTGAELSGATAVVGRGAGAFVRGVSGGRVGGTARPPVFIKGLEHYGNVNEIAGRGRYSPDLLRQFAQRLYDQRRRSQSKAQPGEPTLIEPKGGAKAFFGRDPVNRALVHSGRRFAYGEEQARRVTRGERLQSMNENKPHRGAELVATAAQRLAQKPDTFAADLPKYKAVLDAEFQYGGLTKAQAKMNRALAKQLEKGMNRNDPGYAEGVVHSANHIIKAQNEILDGLVEAGLLNRDQATRRAVEPWAVLHRGAKYENGKLVDRNGQDLPTDAIVADMQSHGVEPPGFLTHRETRRGAGAFYQAFFPDRQTLYSKPWTGTSLKRGTYDASYASLVEGILYAGSKLDAVRSFDKMAQQFTVEAPKGAKSLGDVWTALRDPERFGWQNPAPRVKMRPIRTAPFRAAAEAIAQAKEQQSSPAFLDPSQAAATEALGSKLLDASVAEGPGPYRLIPDALFKELEGQFRRAGTAEKVGGALGGFAKMAWLPFSPSFYTGNFVDQYLRSALSGIGPGDVLLGYQFVHGRHGRLNLPWSKAERIQGLKAKDTAATESIISGAGYSSVARERIHRDARQFEGTALQGFARSLDAFSQVHGPKEVKALFKASTSILLQLNSKLTERLPAYGALGKELRRDMQAQTGAWHQALMIGDGAFKDLLDGTRNTPKQIQYAKAVEQVFGNWGKNSPAARHILTNFAPFWQWARASTRFVFMTMPAHHPIKTALIAAAAEMTQGERERLGLDKYAPEPLPDYLQGTLYGPGGGLFRNLPKYSSPGVVSNLSGFIGHLFLPQLESPLNALQGFDWKGDKLVKSDGSAVNDPERAELSIVLGLEQFIPGLSLLEAATGTTLQPGGGTSTPELRKLSPLAEDSSAATDYLRSLSHSAQITVPTAGGGGGSSGGDFWGGGSSSPSSSGGFWQ